jgi:hypothetical protein
MRFVDSERDPPKGNDCLPITIIEVRPRIIVHKRNFRIVAAMFAVLSFTADDLILTLILGAFLQLPQKTGITLFREVL